jgi:ribosomal protein S18 acetylase RimI-like enzyme
MIDYRPFRNTDPPLLAELWCSHPPRRALVQPMTAILFEQRVLSKPYFDRQGLLVAMDGPRLVGFAHAGFSGNASGDGLDRDVGTTSMLMVGPHPARDEIAAELLGRSERYLLAHGCRMLLGGNAYPANPFYLGLYGDSWSPGLLESDAETIGWFRKAGYEETQRCSIQQRTLGGFRPIVDRLQMQLRRQYQIESAGDPPVRSWWEACTIGQAERTVHTLVSHRTGQVVGSAIFWDMERISTSWGVQAVGLQHVEVDPALRGQGLGTFLVGEALRRSHQAGMALAEAQTAEDNPAALALFRKLGFRQVDRGVVLRKGIG